MSTGRKVLIAVLTGLILLGALLWFLGQQLAHDFSARQKLDDLLGQGQEEPLPPELSQQLPGSPNFPIVPDSPLPNSPPVGLDSQKTPPSGLELPEAPGSELPNAPASPPFGPPAGNFFGFNFPLPKTAVDVKETPQAYELRVPLADPKDERRIRLNVHPHQIEISGQSGSRKGGASFSTSFMQSFTTRQEVLPEKVTRHQEKHGEDTELVIIIPKKSPGSVSEPQGPSKTPNQPDSSAPSFESKNSPAPSTQPHRTTPLNPDTINNGQHTVI